MSEPSAAPTPSFRGRGRGRGRAAARAQAARLAQARKAAVGRRGRQKLYDHPKPQAASERLKELKAAYSAVANALRPALEDLADRSLDQLKNQPAAFRALREYQDVKAFLDRRLRQVQAVNDNRLLLDTRMKDALFEASSRITREGFVRDIEDARDRFVDAQLQRLDLLEQLHDHELPVNIVDDSWSYIEVDEERFQDVKAYVEYRTDLGTHPIYGDKVEVPCSKIGLRLYGAASSDESPVKPSPSSPSPKRKAEGEGENLPPQKRLGAAPRDTDDVPSVVLAPTDEDEAGDVADAADAEPEPANEPEIASPAVAEEDDELLEADDDDNGGEAGEGDNADNGTPAVDDEDGARVSPSDRLPPLPNGASEPDHYGVRLVNKRRTANFDVYNRILVPALFEFEPHEIGFRDSTNDKSRGATKVKRGRFLNTPNSNTMHFDRSLYQCDATTYADGDLDEDVVRRHGLHPRYGLFLRSSVNERGPPKPHVTGMRPAVFYTPQGRTYISSRSVRIARLEDGAELAAKRPVVAAALDRFVEHEHLPSDNLQPPDAVVTRFRDAMMKEWMGPRREVRDETEPVEATETAETAETAESAKTAEAVEAMDKVKHAADEHDVAVCDDAVYDDDDDNDDDDRKIMVGPAAAALPPTQPTAPLPDTDEDALADAVATRAALGALLDAAAAVGDDTAAVSASMSATAAPVRTAHGLADDMSRALTATPPPPPPRRATSRPFDPVRDVFMDQPSVGSPVDRRQSSSADYVPPAHIRSGQAQTQADADATGLLYMASLASDQEYISTYPPRRHLSLHTQPPPPPPPPPSSSYPYRRQESPAPMRYPPTRGMSYDYDSSAAASYPPPPRRMSMDPPQPYHHHTSTPQQQPQLLDPRLFGEAAPPPDAAYGAGRDAAAHYHQPPPSYMPDSNRSDSGGGGGSSSMHPAAASLAHTVPPLPSAAYGQPPPGAHVHPSLPPPPPPPPSSSSSQSHGMAPPRGLDTSPSRGASQYYVSPPPSMLWPYDTRYGSAASSASASASASASRGDPGGYGQGYPPHASHPSPASHPAHPSHAQPPPRLPPYQDGLHAPPSPQMYASHPPAYARATSREYQPHAPYAAGPGSRYGGGSRSPPAPPPNGAGVGMGSASSASSSVVDYAQGPPGPPGPPGSDSRSGGLSNGTGAAAGGGGGGNKYRKLEPAPMVLARHGGEWPGDSDREREREREREGGLLAGIAGNGVGGDGSRPTGHGPTTADVAGVAGASTGAGVATAASGKELRTVPYDYEKIKDYAAVEPPPSHGPKAIRGWAHNNMRRSSTHKGPAAAVSVPIKSESHATEYDGSHGNASGKDNR